MHCIYNPQTGDGNLPQAARAMFRRARQKTDRPEGQRETRPFCGSVPALPTGWEVPRQPRVGLHPATVNLRASDGEGEGETSAFHLGRPWFSSREHRHLGNVH